MHHKRDYSAGTMGIRNTNETLIVAGNAEAHYWQDLWRYRELFYFLAWRDVLIRYRQTAIGIAWALLRPLLTMIAFTLVFGRLAGLASDSTPYALVVFCGLLPWQFFANSFTEAASSLTDNTSLITKVYFPRIIVPTSAVIVSLLELLLSGLILAVLLFWYERELSWRIFTLPLFVIIAFVSAIGAGLWLAALNVKYRDFRYVIPFFVQVSLYLSPVGFSSALVPEAWRMLFSLNPIVGVIDGFRWAILGDEFPLYWPGLWLSTATSVALLVQGIAYFRKMEKSFADVI